MKNVRLLSVGAASLAAATAFLATTVTPAETTVSPGIAIPPTPRPVQLVCGPDIAPTMGESTAGIEVETSEPQLRGSAFAFGGQNPTLDSQPLDQGADVSVYSGDTIGTNLYVESGDSPGAAAGTLSRVQELGELAGLAWVQCVPVAQSHTIVGGSTSLSQSSQLVLTNASTTPSQVTIDVLTSTGVAPATPISTVNVDAQSTEVVLIESGVLDERIAFRINVTGGLVGTQLYTHGVEGISGTGVAVVSAGAEPSTHQVIPGINLNGDGMSNKLRIANPNAEPATVTASVIGGDKRQIPGIVDVTVPPGAVLDLTLEELGEGWAGIDVTSDIAVAASVGVTSPTDTAWVAATPSATRGLVALGAGESRLNIATDESAAVTYTTFDESGTELASTNVNVNGFNSVVLNDDVAYVEVASDIAFYGSVFATGQIGEDGQGIESVPLTIPPSGSAKLDAIVSN